MLRRRLLQRLFSAFPSGAPGVGLLILRVAVGGTLLAQGILCVPSHNQLTLHLLADVVLIASGAALLLGFLTPVLGILAVAECVAVALMWLPIPIGNFLGSRPLLLHMIFTATAISLLGPGAYSLDARLFGWREIVIPPSPNKEEDLL